MTGDQLCERPLTLEPYIEAIGRHDDYYRHVVRGGFLASTTTAGGIVLRALVEVVRQENPMAYIVARVRIGNGPSHLAFDAMHFDRIPREAFDPPTGQVIRRRAPTAPLPPSLPLDVYRPPSRVILPPGSAAEYPLA